MSELFFILLHLSNQSTTNLYQLLLELKLNFRILLIPFIGFVISHNTIAQDCGMLENFPGYSTCCESDNPIECLTSFINSIENEKSFYKEMDGSEANYVKAQYLLQLGLAYKGSNNNELAIQQIKKSLMAVEFAKTFKKANKVKLDKLMWVIRDQGAELCNQLNTENIEDYRECNCDQYLSDYKMYYAWKQEQKGGAIQHSFEKWINDRYYYTSDRSL